MTTNVTSPALYAVGTVTTVVSFLVIGAALGSIALIQRRRARVAERAHLRRRRRRCPPATSNGEIDIVGVTKRFGDTWPWSAISA